MLHRVMLKESFLYTALIRKYHPWGHFFHCATFSLGYKYHQY